MLMVENYLKNTKRLYCLKKRSIRFLSIFIIFVLTFSFIPIKARAVDPLSYMALAEWMNAYGQYYGISTTYDMYSGDGVDNFQDLWDEFNSYQNSAHHESWNADDVYDYIKENDLVTFTDQEGNPSTNPDDWGPNSLVVLGSDEYISEIFDKFWDWMLSSKAELTRSDEVYEFYDFDLIPISQINLGISINGTVLGLLPASTYNAANNRIQFQSTNGIPTYYYITHYLLNGTDYYSAVFLSIEQSIAVRWQIANYGWVNRSSNGVIYENLIYYSDFGINRYVTTTNPNLPYLVDVQDANHQTPPFIWGSNVPVESLDDTISVSPENEDKVALIPNPYAIDYTPTAVDLVIDKDKDGVDDDFPVPLPYPLPDGAVDDIVDGVYPSVPDNDLELVDEDQPEPDPDPPPSGEVFLPFLPVGLPSFNFNFAGIWHYVREWVSSIIDFVTMLFSVYSFLPYAIVLPIYATAVIVIVLGVYKRFFM